MSRQPPDPWRLPTLERLGSDLQKLEKQRDGRHVGDVSARWRVLALAGGALACALAILVVVDGSQRATALSVVNRAAAIAARSGSVAVESAIVITVNGRPLHELSQHGEVDFTTGAYRTTLDVGKGNRLERRRVGGVLYFLYREGTNRGAGRTPRSRSTALRLTHAQQAALTPAPGADAFTDPLALLSLLAKTPAAAARIGGGQVGGVQTVHYRLKSDLASVLYESSGPHAEPAAYRTVRATLNVWLDHQGRPRRVTERLDGTPPLGTATLQATTAFSHYGRPVRISKPRDMRPLAAIGGGPTRASSPVADPSGLFERLVFGTR